MLNQKKKFGHPILLQKEQDRMPKTAEKRLITYWVKLGMVWRQANWEYSIRFYDTVCFIFHPTFVNKLFCCPLVVSFYWSPFSRWNYFQIIVMAKLSNLVNGPCRSRTIIILWGKKLVQCKSHISVKIKS